MGCPACLCSVGKFMFPTASLAGRTQGPACSRITQICLFLQALNEEIVNRKKNVDQAIRNGQALLKQTTGNRSWKCGGSGNPSSTPLPWEAHALLGGAFSPSGLHFLLETPRVAGLHPGLDAKPQTLQLRICLVPKSQPPSLGSG